MQPAIRHHLLDLAKVSIAIAFWVVIILGADPLSDRRIFTPLF